MNFSIAIGAKDTSGAAIRGATQRFLSFAKAVSKPIRIPLRVARKGLSLARDVQLGLRPIIAGIDNLIERGSGLEVVRKSFESLMGTGGRSADMLARKLRNAANGTIRIGRAMQIANRGLASGLSFDQLLVSMDFVSKKAITTGMSADQAVDKVITGLARGSVLFLDDFGLVIDGLAGISREYDRINGKGAFDSLGPAAQKAAIVAQAIKEMREQLGKIGVSGKETVFLFKGFKNQIGDAVDKLVLAIAKTKILKSVLTGFRNILSGITRHFEKGPGDWHNKLLDVLDGKKDSQGKRSGGLLGIARGALLDLGELIGRGLLGGLLGGLSELPDLFSTIWSKLTDIIDYAIEAIPGAIEKGFEWLTTNLPAIFKKAFPMLAKVHGETTNALAGWIQKTFSSWFDRARPDGSIDRGIVDMMADTAGKIKTRPIAESAEAYQFGAMVAVEAMVGGFSRVWAKLAGNPDPGPLDMSERLKAREEAREEGRRKRRAEEQHSCGDALGKTLERWGKPGSRQSGGGQLGVTPQTLPILHALLALTTGGKPGSREAGALPTPQGLGFAEILGDLSDKVLSGGIFSGKSRARDRALKFFKNFPAEEQPETPDPMAKELSLSQLAILKRWRRVHRIDREIKLMESGGRGIHQRALAETNRRVRKLRADGRFVPPSVRRRIFDEEKKRITKEATQGLREERKQIEEAINNSHSITNERIERKREEAKARRQSRGDKKTAPASSSATGGALEPDKSLGALIKSVEQNTQAANQVFAALTGANAKLTQSA